MAKTIANNISFTGRIGDYTFYRRRGHIIVRPRRNEFDRRKLGIPQKQRSVSLSNCNNLWRQFQPDCKLFFTQGHGGSTAYSQFLSHAMQASPIYLTREQGRAGGCVATNVAVSDGTLPPIRLQADAVAPATSISLGGLTDTTGLTVGQLAQAVLDHNDDFLSGDCLLYYLFLQWWDAEAGCPRVRISCQSLTLTPADPRPLADVVGSCIGFAVRDGRLAASQNPQGGMAWVHLRPGRHPQVSHQQLLCNNSLITQYGSDEAFEAACRSYNL